jgi:hypothetical protein
MIQKIFYIHIPKTSGSTMETIFYENSGCISTCFFRKLNNEIVQNKKYKYLSLWHIPFQFLKKSFTNNIIQNYTIFAIVRNPYTRIISDFKFWIDFYNTRMNLNNISQKDKFLLKEIKTIYNNNFSINKENLNIFINNVLNNKKNYTILDGHIIPQIEHILIKNNNKLNIFTNDILKMENLNNDFNNFIKKYNLNIPLNITKTTKINITSNKLTIKDLNQNSINLINKFYHYDFKFFNYEKL